MLHACGIERHVRGDLAIILEIDPAAVENFHRLAHALGTLPDRLAEVGVGEHCHAWFIAHATRDACGLGRDIGKILCIRLVVHCRVGNEYRAATGNDERDANHPVAWLGGDAAPHICKRRGVVAGRAGHHRIRIADRDHRCSKMIAVIVD
ncbi:hypothetical protein D3C87_1692020 [compost metagenome]